MRPFARRDSNEIAFRAALGKTGWLTKPLSIKDWPDLIAIRAGTIRLVELKVGKNGLSHGQTACHAMLASFGIQVIVARTPEEFFETVDTFG